MNEDTKRLINKSVENIITKMSDSRAISKLFIKHDNKVHFIPKSYRVFGGMLQSMNIQFGNFIEELMTLLIENEDEWEIVAKYSGKKSNSFLLSKENDTRIDRYISDCQLSGDGYCTNHFPILQQDIINDQCRDMNNFKHDIDLLFKSKSTGKYYYLEIKYNDDHDTGKFVDINRKFIKTYAYLVNELNVRNVDDLTPIIFYFNNKRMKGNPYVPESANIKRGSGFFDDFLEKVKYSDVSGYMASLSESDEVIDMFYRLYSKIMKNE